MVSSFGAWSACSKSCGGGVSSRSRSQLVAAEHGGALCPHLGETKACNAADCPVDCAMGTFGEWGSCTLSCGSGSRTRHRSITTHPFYGGKACPHADETEGCNTFACPVDCAVTSWPAWGACSASCGTGWREHDRSIVHGAAHGGEACPPLTEKDTCNTHDCPVDCVVSEWADWGACSATCHTGVMIRTRDITVNSHAGGKACEHLSETKTCDRGACPVHCQVSSWAAWTPCTKSCGEGKHGRTRSIVRQALYGGYVCPMLAQERTCNEHPCPVDCLAGVWEAWSGCSHTCGGGQKQRVRALVQESAHGGACVPLMQVDSCNAQHCPVDCVHGDWGEWGGCVREWGGPPQRCNGGVQFRLRQMVSAPTHGGALCGALQQEARCNEQKCRRSDNQPCSHVQCDYFAHSVAHEPTLGGSDSAHPGFRYSKEHPGQLWHVGVVHDRSEQHGFHHHCQAVNAGAWNERRDQQKCRCTCWAIED